MEFFFIRISWHFIFVSYALIKNIFGSIVAPEKHTRYSGIYKEKEK